MPNTLLAKLVVADEDCQRFQKPNRTQTWRIHREPPESCRRSWQTEISISNICLICSVRVTGHYGRYGLLAYLVGVGVVGYFLFIAYRVRRARRDRFPEWRVRCKDAVICHVFGLRERGLAGRRAKRNPERKLKCKQARYVDDYRGTIADQKSK